MACRACGGLLVAVVDLGAQPSGGSFPAPGDPPDEQLPLALGSCTACGLAQLVHPSPPESDDPDGPSPLSSSTMSAHARAFVQEFAGRGLATPSSRILSVASHGGHLAPFLAELGLRATILEGSPTRAARLAAGGLPVVIGALDGDALPGGLSPGSFDLVVDSYLLAHLERPRVAIRRLADLLAPGGSLVLEFDHLLATVEGGQWDAIRHGHQTYLALGWVARELEAAGLVVLDAAPQPVYGGAMRVHARAGARSGDGRAGRTVAATVAREAAAGIDTPSGLALLGATVERARSEVVGHLRAARDAGRPVVGYGAPARAITFLNALGIGPDLLPYTVDRAPVKQGRTIPGVRIPIRAPAALEADLPAEILVLAWDLATEIRASLDSPALAGTRFLVGVPSLAEVADPAAAPGLRGGTDVVG